MLLVGSFRVLVPGDFECGVAELARRRGVKSPNGNNAVNSQLARNANMSRALSLLLLLLIMFYILILPLTIVKG